MAENIFIVNKHSQIRELGSTLKYQIINELFRNSATCQQLAEIFNITKQKMHYNLKCLYDEGLIDIEEETLSNKEVYYKVKARNYILDFSMGLNTENYCLNNREILSSILENNYNLNLNRIAAKLLDDSLKVKPGQRILIVTGKYNLPLVERLLQEAGKRKIVTTLEYQELDLIKARNEEFSLSAFKHHYDNFNRLLRKHDFYLNLNGEARYAPLEDKRKLEIRKQAFIRSREILQKNGIKVVIMPGLIKDTLSEHNVISEINFWKALDVDYTRLFEATEKIRQNAMEAKHMQITSNGHTFTFEIDRIVCEYGSFNDNPYQSPTINLPGGEVLIVPRPGTLNGRIRGSIGYAFGEKIHNPEAELLNNQITEYSSVNSDLIARAIEEGGVDGRKVAMICLGTNYNMQLDKIDSSYRNKCEGLLTIYWGENITFEGDVRGECEWHIQLENPIITFEK